MSHEEIGEANEALLCLTNKIDCCTLNESQGDWYDPENNLLPNKTTGHDGNSVYTSKGPSYIRLNKVKGNNNINPGVYHCKIPDSNGTDQRIYIGIYGNEEGGTKDFQSVEILLILFICKQVILSL